MKLVSLFVLLYAGAERVPLTSAPFIVSVLKKPAEQLPSNITRYEAACPDAFIGEREYIAFIVALLKADGDTDPKVAGVYAAVETELEYPYR